MLQNMASFIEEQNKNNKKKKSMNGSFLIEQTAKEQLWEIEINIKMFLFLFLTH